MYTPEAFAVADPAEVEAALSDARFACLVTHDGDGLFASHLPMIYDAGRRVLAGHLARPNPHRGRAGDGNALAIFQGPEGYVSPGWYPSKAEHGRVVPTWNYEAVHVRGRLTWFDDPEWIVAHLRSLTNRFEAEEAQPWSVDDAPADFVRGLARGVVGVELSVEAVTAKRKLSQNRSADDRRGVIAGLGVRAGPGDPALAAAMARALAADEEP